jgi:hypothetical protein
MINVTFVYFLNFYNICSSFLKNIRGISDFLRCSKCVRGVSATCAFSSTDLKVLFW